MRWIRPPDRARGGSQTEPIASSGMGKGTTVADDPSSPAISTSPGFDAVTRTIPSPTQPPPASKATEVNVPAVFPSASFSAALGSGGDPSPRRPVSCLFTCPSASSRATVS